MPGKTVIIKQTLGATSDASLLTSGTLAAARLPATAAKTDAANVFTKAETFQPDSDAQAGTFRRFSSTQTQKIVEWQTEVNVSLGGVDKDGNISTAGSISSGVGSSVAGYSAMGQGTATTAPTSSVGFQAPTSVTTKYMITLPGAPATGAVIRTGATDPTVELIVAPSANGSVLVSNGTTFVSGINVVPVSIAISVLAIDWALAKVFTKTLGANSTFTFSNATDGQTIVVALTNTASNYTVTWPTVSWSGGTAPTQTVGAKIDVYTFIKIGSTIFGSVVQNF